MSHGYCARSDPISLAGGSQGLQHGSAEPCPVEISDARAVSWQPRSRRRARREAAAVSKERLGSPVMAIDQRVLTIALIDWRSEPMLAMTADGS